ncbi:FCD domain-containing protein [Thalassospira sp.]|uniref:FCD domain-containing protein n=1 Tax=Thalassospira sp. TaxID=1912094 RepID=UPI003AA97F03
MKSHSTDKQPPAAQLANQTRTEATHTGRAADEIVRHIEKKIVSGALPDRSPLPAERDLMAQFGTSRTVVREAITALSNRGLIENRPRFRPIVRKPGYETIIRNVDSIVGHLLSENHGVKNLYDTRVFLERALVREAALNAQTVDIRKLKSALLANEKAINDSTLFYETDVAFHGVLYDVPQNPIFPAIHQAYLSWLAPHWRRMPRSPERNLVNFRSHQAIAEAIFERDAEAADEALTRHLHAAWEYVRVTFEPEETK